MATVYNFKITGRTSTSTDGTATGLLGTKSVTYDSDGYVRWADANGRPRSVQIQGDLANLFREIFAGTGGLDAGTTNVQGHRVFGEPQLPQ